MTDTLDRAGYEESEALDLRYYASLARRYLALLIAVPVLFAVAGYLNSDRQARMYAATTQVLLRPNDPNERLGSSTNANVITSNIEQSRRPAPRLHRPTPSYRRSGPDHVILQSA